MKIVYYCIVVILQLAAIAGHAQFTGKPIYEIEVRRADTSMGKITVEMFPAIAPNHVRNWDSLVTIKFYDSIAFHRVIPDFMVQGGDPNSRSGDPSTWGYGDPEQQTIDAEFNAVSHRRGILSAARTPDPNSATSQFFICVGNPTHLDRNYTVYGRAIGGMDVVDSIVLSETDGTMPIDKISMFITKTGMNDEQTTVPEHVFPPTDTSFNIATSSVRLRWHHVSGAMQYRLQITYGHPSFGEIVVDTTTSQLDTSIIIRKLEQLKSYYWRVMANNGGHASDFSDPWVFMIGGLSVGSKSDDVSLEIHSNPAIENTRISYRVASGARATIVVADVLGRIVESIGPSEMQSEGDYILDSKTFAKGMYTVRLEAGDDSIIRKLIIQ